jgi:hypothetical protein
VPKSGHRRRLLPRGFPPWPTPSTTASGKRPPSGAWGLVDQGPCPASGATEGRQESADAQAAMMDSRSEDRLGRASDRTATTPVSTPKGACAVFFWWAPRGLGSRFTSPRSTCDARGRGWCVVGRAKAVGTPARRRSGRTEHARESGRADLPRRAERMGRADRRAGPRSRRFRRVGRWAGRSADFLVVDRTRSSSKDYESGRRKPARRPFLTTACSGG